MMEALDKTPKPATVIKTQDDDSFILNEDPLLMVSGVTCHSTPSKKQHERYGRSRNSSLPSTDKPKKRSSSYSHSYDRQNSLDSELDQGCSNQSILKEKRLEFERRREQVSLKYHCYFRLLSVLSYSPIYIYKHINFLQVRLRRKKQQQDQELYEKAVLNISKDPAILMAQETDALPNFALGAETQSCVKTQEKANHQGESLNGISSFFPVDKNSDQSKMSKLQQKNALRGETYKEQESSSGRVVETVTGENVFIPTLNFESVCSATECSGDNFNKNGNFLQGL